MHNPQRLLLTEQFPIEPNLVLGLSIIRLIHFEPFHDFPRPLRWQVAHGFYLDENKNYLILLCLLVVHGYHLPVQLAFVDETKRAKDLDGSDIKNVFLPGGQVHNINRIIISLS
jgi:hypothetical protein